VRKDVRKEKVLPGLEPGSPGSKPGVLTNYTIEPCVALQQVWCPNTAGFDYQQVIRSRIVRVIMSLWSTVGFVTTVNGR
jgi:hypothetical protein